MPHVAPCKCGDQASSEQLDGLFKDGGVIQYWSVLQRSTLAHQITLSGCLDSVENMAFFCLGNNMQRWSNRASYVSGFVWCQVLPFIGKRKAPAVHVIFCSKDANWSLLSCLHQIAVFATPWRRDRQDRLAWKKVFLSLGLQKMLKDLRWTFPRLLAFGLWPQMEGIGMWWYNMMVGLVRVYVRIIDLISCSSIWSTGGDRRSTLTQSNSIEVVHSYLTSNTLFASRICSIGTWLSWLEACFTSAAARGFARWSMRFANAGWAVSLQRMSSDVLECFESLWNLLPNLCRRPEHGFWYRPQQRQPTFKLVPWLYLKIIYCIRTLHDCTPPKGEQCGVFCEWHCDSIWMPVPDSSSYRPDRSGFPHMLHDPHRISSSSLLNLLHKERALRTASLSDNWLEEWVGKRRNDFESVFFHFLFCVKCDHLRH